MAEAAKNAEMAEQLRSQIAELKAEEPWLFADAPTPQQGGKTGLPNAGTSSDEGKTMKRWRKIAGLDDVDNE